jgi:antimicrobial peptide system SdpB family protein
MLNAFGKFIRRVVFESRWHTNVIGLARTSIALGTLGTLFFSHSSSIFRPGVGVPLYPSCDGVTRAGLFCMVGAGHLELARWLGVLALALVASGWRPRFTGVVHWYVAWSLFTSGLLVDGGDQIASILTLLLIPVTLADPREWHWDAAPAPVQPKSQAGAVAQMFARSCLFVIRLQIAGLYFQAAVAKMRVPEWRDGTAVYYWFTDPAFGFYGVWRHLMAPLLANGMIVSAMTWGAMALEIFLFAALIGLPGSRRVLLVLGILFHGAIAAVHGLPSFAFSMWGALILYLRPVEMEFAFAAARWGRVCAWLKNRRLERLPRFAPRGVPVP